MVGPTARTIGKYQLVKVIGEGAMGVVYQAYDPGLERHVALKLIRKDVLEGKQAAQMVARFRNEALAAARLQHPGIVSVYDFGEDDSTSFIVMELASGEELEAYVQRRAPLTFADVGTLMAQLLDALHYAHAAGVVHRDIKPSNVLVSPEGKVKITDFGIARIGSSKLTQTGTAVGTPMYMAPEQFTGTGVDHRADLFSAGVVLYELLTGYRPFEGEGFMEVAYKVCHTEPAPPSFRNPSLPAAIDACVARALAKDKMLRYASAHELSHAVTELLGGVVAHTAPPSAPAAAAALGSGAPMLSNASRAGLGSWSSDVTRALEQAMVKAVGPLASALVRRSQARTVDRSELIELLRRGAGAEADNPSLLRDLRAVLDANPQVDLATAPTPIPTPPPPQAARPAPTPLPAAGLTPAELDRATQALVGFLGPIAKVLVKKTAAQARDFRELCTKLSENLATEAERADFLRKSGARS